MQVRKRETGTHAKRTEITFFFKQALLKSVSKWFKKCLLHTWSTPLTILACASRASQMPHRKRKKKLKDGLVLKSSSSFTRIFIRMICAFGKVHAASCIQIPTKKFCTFSLLSRDFVPWMQISHHQRAYETKMILQISKPQSWGGKCVCLWVGGSPTCAGSISFDSGPRSHWQRGFLCWIWCQEYIDTRLPCFSWGFGWKVNFHNIKKLHNSISISSKWSDTLR